MIEIPTEQHKQPEEGIKPSQDRGYRGKTAGGGGVRTTAGDGERAVGGGWAKAVKTAGNGGVPVQQESEKDINQRSRTTANPGEKKQMDTIEFPSAEEILNNFQYPKAYGVNLDDIFGSLHSAGALRSGQASNDHMCDTVTAVPGELRNSSVMYPGGINEFYQKYTHAYGIPILGSNNVTDAGLMRICYAVRRMLSARYDIRNVYYKFYGSVAAIGDDEQQTSLWQYRNWDSSYWDWRARGLGPTVDTPLTSVGDDNQRCTSADRYPDQDIFTHEFGHAVHLLGAYYVIPGFGRHLGDAYWRARDSNMWSDTYAGSNINEYWASGTQHFFNATSGFQISPQGSAFAVSNAATLQMYDPDLYDLLSMVYSCGGEWIERCQYKGQQCGLQSYARVSKNEDSKKLFCPKIFKVDYVATVEECAQLACSSNASAFNYFSNARQLCHAVNCNNGLVFIDTNAPVVSVYQLTTPPSILEEVLADVPTMCLRSSPPPADLCAVTPRTTCGPAEASSDEVMCYKLGCCWEEGQCFYPEQTCKDQDIYCGDMARDRKCTANPGWMFRKCPFACDVCQFVKLLPEDFLTSMCQDTSIHCGYWVKSGFCTHSTYGPGVRSQCKMGCGECTLADDPFQAITREIAGVAPGHPRH